MKELIKKDSYSYLLNYINVRSDLETTYIQKYYSNKIENKLDYIYQLSSYRDMCIANIDNKINFLMELEKKYLEEAKYKFDNLEITETEYNKLASSIKSGNYKKQSKKILLLKNKKNKKLLKWEKLINKNKDKNKIKIKRINEKQDKVIIKLNYRVNKLLKILESNNKELIELDKKSLEKKIRMIKYSKCSKKIIKLENKLKNNKIGPLDYENKKNKFNEDKDIEIEKINMSNETLHVKKYIMKVNNNFILSFSNRKKILNKSINSISSVKLVFIIMFFAIIVGIIEPGFFSENNWKNILYLNADIGCMAIGVTVIILTGGIDLSIGSTLAFATALAAKLILSGANVWLSLLVVILFCGLSGFISGIFVSILKFPSFIITLILMMVWRGSAQYILENTSRSFDNISLTNLIQTKFLGLSIVVWIMFLLALVSFIILRCTVYGRHVYAVGGNYKSAQLSGIKAKTILTSVYVFGGLCVGIGSVIYAARIQTASPSAGNAWELDAIACVVLGGTLLTGGKGGVFLTILGWFTLSVLKNALNLIGLSSDVQNILKGLIIMVAVFSNTEYKITQKIKKWVSKTFNNIRTL
ncbi:ABC transporter permease [Spiroplasma turonicum]|uniref:Ribose ABC transporter n=1 Tax=Spiroplasma turonicum TaxID=216946 RepID=A0A0K1P6J7_9MOLU|nr:ABC transporter permease [Spiroplasma turonicum]AKU79946.1 ribose ABC transporter [Spiroplasma turonicum]ALX70959.1 ribose ABC transporter permease protein [Spiroplasma turonicum]